jgi:hypothetical protein
MVGEHYRIPYVQISEILANAPNLKVDTEATESDWLAEDYAEDKNAIDAYLKAGVLLESIKVKKEEGDDDDEGPKFISGYAKKQLPDFLRTLFKLIKHRLQQPDCKNRGFIFDGSPVNFEDVKHIFLEQKKKLNRKAKRAKKVKTKKKEKKERAGEDGAKGSGAEDSEEGESPEGGENAEGEEEEAPEEDAPKEEEEEEGDENAKQKAEVFFPASVILFQSKISCANR